MADFSKPFQIFIRIISPFYFLKSLIHSKEENIHSQWIQEQNFPTLLCNWSWLVEYYSMLHERFLRSLLSSR